MTSSRVLPLLAIFFGLCTPLALAPFKLWPLMLISVGGFFWLTLVAKTSKQALGLGWLFGVGFFGLGVSWIYGSMQTVDTPVFLALILTTGFCLLLALLPAIHAWAYVKFFRGLPNALLVIAPLMWVISEWVREWLLTGMPWLFAGYASISMPLAQIAAIIGIYGLSWVMASLAALLLSGLLDAFNNKEFKMLNPIVMALGMFAALNILGALVPATSWTEVDREINVAAVQSNVDQRTKWARAQQRPTLEFYGESIGQMVDVDLVLWPEAAMTQRPEQIPYFFAQIENIGDVRDQAIVTGLITREGDKYFNAIQGFGSAKGEYRKQHLVPFGEYVPLEGILRGLIAFFDLPTSTMYPAGEEQFPIYASLNGDPYLMAPIICYEAAYPNIVRLLARQSEIITVISNDAWFGDSLGPHQHLEITQMRAIENGRAIVRATQNGISALISADGKILQRSEQFVPAELIGDMPLRKGLTPFQIYPAQTLPVFAVFALISLYLRGRKQRSPVNQM